MTRSFQWSEEGVRLRYEIEERVVEKGSQEEGSRGLGPRSCSERETDREYTAPDAERARMRSALMARWRRFFPRRVVTGSLVSGGGRLCGDVED